MIKQSIVIMIAMFSMAITSAQDVRYYQLTRKEENGISSKSVSGGQFITFISDICYESNKKGIGVGHGNMTRNSNYSNSQYSVYQGSSYWGKNTTFKFNSDKSVLNVVLENGDVYIYKRATAPAGQETCSLIRKTTPSNNNGGGTVVVTPPVNPGGQVVIPPTNPTSPTNPGETTPTPSHGREARQVTETCMSCGGSGKCSTCNGRHWYYGYTGNAITCPNCPPNGACQKCGGSGKITKTEWW